MDILTKLGLKAEKLEDLPTDAEVQAEKEAELEAQRTLVLTQIVRSVPIRYRGTTMARCPSGSALEAATAWAQGSGWCLLLEGPRGTGKTTLGTAVWKALAAAKLSSIRTAGLGSMPTAMELAIWKSSDTIWDEYRLNVGENMQAAALYTSLLKHVPVLLIDDLQPRSDRASEWFSSLLLHRYDHGVRTIITTNFTPQQWRAMDERVFSRLAGDSVRVTLEGKDHRLEQG